MKRSILIAGHSTSISLEPEFWESLKTIANEANKSVAGLVRDIDDAYSKTQESKVRNLSSRLRIYILKYYQSRCTETADK